MSCSSYENISCGNDWKEVLKNDIKKQYEVAQIVFERQNQREDIISALQGGQPLLPGSRAPGD